MAVLNTLNTRFKLLFALLLVVALPVFIWAVATQRIELRKRAATSEPPIVCWNRLHVQGDTIPDNISWPDGCKGNPTPGICTMATVPLTATEKYNLQQWISAGRPWLNGCELYYPTPTPSPQPECQHCQTSNDCNPGLICQSVPTPTPNCPNGPNGPCAIPLTTYGQRCVKPDGSSQCSQCLTSADCPANTICSAVPPGGCQCAGGSVGCACAQPPRCWPVTPTPTPASCTPLPSCAYNSDPTGALCAIPQFPPGGGSWCPRPSPPSCTPLPSCAYNTGFSGTDVYCKISATPPNGGSWCPRPIPPPTPINGCYYQQVECFRAPCYPILVCPQTSCPGPNGSSCSIQKCPQPYSCPEGTFCPMYKTSCVNQPGTCQNNQCIINPPPVPITCNYTTNPPNLCPVGYSCRYSGVPITYLRSDAVGGAGGAIAESTAVSVDTATTSYWRGRSGVCVPDYPGCGPEGSSCIIGSACPPQPTCAPGVPCPRMAVMCKRAAGVCKSGQCVPPPSPPYISNAGIMTNYNPWSVWVVATNLTASPMNARLYDTDGAQWGSTIPVTVGSTPDYQFAGFSLPTNTPPSNCNKGKTCTISVDLVPTTGSPSNRFSLTLPSSESITCVRNTPSVKITPQIQSGNPGATLLYIADITNNDSAGCAPARFSLATKVPDGFKGYPASNTLNLAPQQTLGVSFPVTSPSNNPNAATISLPISFTAKNPDTGLESSSDATYTYVQPVSTTVKFLFKFAGVTGDNKGAENEIVKVIFSPRTGAAYTLSPDLKLKFTGNGVYEANYTIKDPLPPDTQFTMLVKGPKHGAVRFCQQTGQTAPCPYGSYMKAVGSTFDFTGRPLPAGDLNQSNIIDQADVKFVTDLLSKPSSSRKPEDIKRADVNYDGLVDIRDLNLIVQSLSVRQDE